MISGEEGAQKERLKYILGHGAKEGLTERASHRPGVHCIKALLEDVPLIGQWFDRTKESGARRRDEEFERLCYATSYPVELSPCPVGSI